ncbi:DNA-binding protein [Mycolicibacterium novocastrense]|uniref:DNA-binding protein n=1 Tax=Mycolicibacterium novocastrense TaxID=59813 RepID=A0AAW5SMZ9_MYCNV|nr:DNA-binding protein [Mycolicibacterium novocastrense]
MQSVTNEVGDPFKQYLDGREAVSYLHALGFTTATVETVKYHAYYTGKLPKPKIVGRQAYWSRTDLDRLVESL